MLTYAFIVCKLHNIFKLDLKGVGRCKKTYGAILLNSKTILLEQHKRTTIIFFKIQNPPFGFPPKISSILLLHLLYFPLLTFVRYDEVYVSVPVLLASFLPSVGHLHITFHSEVSHLLFPLIAYSTHQSNLPPPSSFSVFFVVFRLLEFNS